MAAPRTLVLSASRRTDIPAFYLDWFMACIERQSFQVTNPYNRVTRIVPVSPDNVHTIVFWSKNFGPFLEENVGEELVDRGYRLAFQFTVNSASRLLEPKVPPLEKRLNQLFEICRRFDALTVTWRFDPVCFYETSGGMGNNLLDFKTIAASAAASGVRRCVTSFVDNYRKVRKRLAAIEAGGGPSIRFEEPTMDKKVAVLTRMETVLSGLGIRLFTCCESGVQSHLPDATTIEANACISGHLLKHRFGGNPETARDYGQRAGKGCRCTRAVDVGSYREHPCHHDCLFCYASPSLDLMPAKGDL